MNYRRIVRRVNEITYLCIEYGIRFENINMIGLRIYYSENGFRWFKCSMEELDKAEEYVFELIYEKMNGRQSSLDEYGE